jgi:hypothetical protein
MLSIRLALIGLPPDFYNKNGAGKLFMIDLVVH